MNKKHNDLELTIYKKLGVLHFKKLVLSFYNKCLGPLNHSNFGNIYVIGKEHSLESIKDYKKRAHINVIASLYIIIATSLLLNNLLIAAPIALISTYCIMLQRYNLKRLNKCIKKLEVHEPKQKEKIKKDLIEKYPELENEKFFTYTDKKKLVKEKVLFKDFLNNASLSELRNYREILNNYTVLKNIDSSLKIKKLERR